ncbi:PD-(D/E)XK nuclease family protein [Fervidibacter sacchari]
MEREELLALMAKELPRLLQEHPEARYQLIGILAEVFARRDEFQEILASIREIIQRQEEHSRILQEHTRTLREHSHTLEEHTRTLREHSRILEEHTRTLQEHTRIIQEHSRTIERHSQILQEHSRTIERHSQILQEHSQTIQRQTQILEEHTNAIRSLIEQQQRLTEEVVKMGRTLSAVGARWGYLAEEAFRQGLEAIVAEQLGLKVEKWRWWDEEGFVFGRPDWIEVDVAIHDEKHILVQIASSATRGEVAAFYRIGQLYERLKGIKPSLLFVAVFLDERAKELAQKLGIEVRTAP